MKNKPYTGKDLTVVICAYKECPNLEDSIRAIVYQSWKPNILISTSTPNSYIEELAAKYQIEVCVNPEGGHVRDYNYAISQVKTPLGMLAHQDDVLRKTFVEDSLKALNKADRPILSFTDYIEMHDDKVDRKASGLVRIKRILVIPMRLPFLRKTRFGKRLGQCFGNPITHPSVICVMKEMPTPLFQEQFRASMDWDLWERLSRKEGEFVFVPKVLLYHRMNKENATAKLLESTNIRYQEEYEIMSRFWPKWFARVIMKAYSKSAKYY